MYLQLSLTWKFHVHKKEQIDLYIYKEQHKITLSWDVMPCRLVGICRHTASICRVETYVSWKKAINGFRISSSLLFPFIFTFHIVILNSFHFLLLFQLYFIFSSHNLLSFFNFISRILLQFIIYYILLAPHILFYLLLLCPFTSLFVLQFYLSSHLPLRLFPGPHLPIQLHPSHWFDPSASPYPLFHILWNGFPSALKPETAGSSETSVPIHQTTRRHIIEHRNIHNLGYDNSTPYKAKQL
jgi:hypothetical protein